VAREWESHDGYLGWLLSQHPRALPTLYRKTLERILRAGVIDGRGNRYSLTHQQIAKEFGVTRSAAKRRVRWLVDHGYLIVCRGGHRSTPQVYHRSTPATPYRLWKSYPGCECGGERKRPRFQVEAATVARTRALGMGGVLPPQNAPHYAPPTYYPGNAAHGAEGDDEMGLLFQMTDPDEIAAAAKAVAEVRAAKKREQDRALTPLRAVTASGEAVRRPKKRP
jgi:hypothetical protein